MPRQAPATLCFTGFLLSQEWCLVGVALSYKVVVCIHSIIAYTQDCNRSPIGQVDHVITVNLGRIVSIYITTIFKCAQIDHILTGCEVHDVVVPAAGFEHEGVGTRTAVHQVVVLTADQNVVVFAAVHLVVTGAAVQGVPAGLAENPVIASLAVHRVIEVIALQGIVAAVAVDGLAVEDEVVCAQVIFLDAVKCDLTAARQTDFGILVVLPH